MKTEFRLFLTAILLLILPVCSSAQTDTALFRAGCEYLNEGYSDLSEATLIRFLSAESRDTLCRRPDLRLESYILLARIREGKNDFDHARKWLRCAHTFALRNPDLADRYVPVIKAAFVDMKSTEAGYSRLKTQLVVMAICLGVLLLTVVLVYMVLYSRLRKSYAKLAERARAWAIDVPASPEGEGFSAESPLLQRIRELFARDKVYLDNTITLDSLSEALHTNRTYVSSAIRAVSPNFNRFVSGYRIRDAVRLLDGGWDGTIEELALRCGYSNAKTFSNAFKDITGLTPGAFRSNI